MLLIIFPSANKFTTFIAFRLSTSAVTRQMSVSKKITYGKPRTGPIMSYTVYDIKFKLCNRIIIELACVGENSLKTCVQ